MAGHSWDDAAAHPWSDTSDEDDGAAGSDDDDEGGWGDRRDPKDATPEEIRASAAADFVYELKYLNDCNKI